MPVSVRRRSVPNLLAGLCKPEMLVSRTSSWCPGIQENGVALSNMSIEEGCWQPGSGSTTNTNTFSTSRTASLKWFERVAGATGEDPSIYMGTRDERGRFVASWSPWEEGQATHSRALIGHSRSWTPTRTRSSAQSRITHRHSKHNRVARTLSTPISTDDGEDCFERRASPRTTNTLRTASRTWFERVASATGEEIGTLHARGRCVDSSGTTPAPSILPRAPHVRALIGKSRSWTPLRNRESTPSVGARHRKHSSESSRTSSSSAQSSTDDIADCFQQRAPSSSRSTKSPPSSRRASLTWFERVASATGEDMGTLHARGRCVDSSDTTAAHSIRPRAPHVRALIGKSQSWTPPRNRESAPTPDASRQSPKQSLAKSVAARRLQAQYTSLQHSVSAGDLEACSPSTRRTKLDQELECKTIDRALHRACVSRNARSPPPDPTNNNGVIILDASSPLGVFVRMLLVIFAVVASVFCRLTPHTHKNARLQPLVSMEASADELVALVQDLNAAKTRVANERMHKVQGLARQLHAISLAEGQLPQRPIHRTKSY